MNKEKVIQELDEMENHIKGVDGFQARFERLRRLIDGSGFDWDFGMQEYDVDVNDQLRNVDEFDDIDSAIKAEKMCAWICLLQHLADHFNPAGWEWDVFNDYSVVVFEADCLSIKVQVWCAVDVNLPKFHPDVIDDVIEELNNNKSKWWHLVTDKPLEES